MASMRLYRSLMDLSNSLLNQYQSIEDELNRLNKILRKEMEEKLNSYQFIDTGEILIRVDKSSEILLETMDYLEKNITNFSNKLCAKIMVSDYEKLKIIDPPIPQTNDRPKYWQVNFERYLLEDKFKFKSMFELR